ncbi:MAG: DNA-directed RNA polymerase subunit omega [Candidatus Omnitrophota bacterium]
MPIDKLLDKTGSIYKLVILASHRALELTDGAASKLVDADPDLKAPDIALKEILEGKITFKNKEAKETK